MKSKIMSFLIRAIFTTLLLSSILLFSSKRTQKSFEGTPSIFDTQEFIESNYFEYKYNIPGNENEFNYVECKYNISSSNPTEY
jgi:hypothetical protein